MKLQKLHVTVLVPQAMKLRKSHAFSYLLCLSGSAHFAILDANLVRAMGGQEGPKEGEDRLTGSRDAVIG